MSFNPRSHEGNDDVQEYINSFREVSIHVPTRGTTMRHRYARIFDTVSIHVPTRGTTGLRIGELLDLKFQSTFPRGERHGYDVKDVILSNVSIHVPTRGTTEPVVPNFSVHPVSIHVPTRGTTNGDRPGMRNNAGFNPRSHEGNDAEKSEKGENMSVSIHVPTRGTTRICKFFMPLIVVFQSTFPRGERLR